MTRIILFYFIFLSTSLLGQTKTELDTIIIQCRFLKEQSFYPSRACHLPFKTVHQNSSQYHTPYYDSMTVNKGYRDSIKVSFQVIDKFNQHYYLIVKDSLGRVRLKGTFYDAFADGIITEYYENGEVHASGYKKMLTTKKKFEVCDGYYCCPKIKLKLYDNRYSACITWNEYTENSKLIKTLKNSIETKESWETEYDTNGLIIRTSYFKNGKLKN